MGDRWWHVFFGITMGVVVLLAWTGGETGQESGIPATVIVVTLTLCWLTFGRRGFGGSPPGVAFSAVLIVGAGLLVGIDPSLAIVQAIIFPLLWSLSARRRNAIVANAVLALVVFVAFLVEFGTEPADVFEAAMIQACSFVGSVALGMWISHIADLSQERLGLIDELTAAQNRLASLSRESGITSERERLARELHDTIAQSLTGVVMIAQRSQRELAAGNLSGLADQLKLLEDGGREALAETRSLVAASAPVELGFGIGPALDRLAERFARETGIAVHSDVAEGLAPDRDAQVVLLRCAQEGLANVRKHSKAASVRMVLAPDPGGYRLTIEDDGTGFDALHAAPGFGLSGMRERLALVDGRLEVASSPSNGTTLSAFVPMAVPA
jgi:signal transduction histidine kinase